MIYASKHGHASRSNFRFEPIHRLLRIKVAWDNDQSLCRHFRSRRLGCPPEHSPTNQDKDRKTDKPWGGAMSESSSVLDCAQLSPNGSPSPRDACRVARLGMTTRE